MSTVSEDCSNILKLVINSIPGYIFWKDVNSVFLGCNDKFAQIIGLDKPEDIIGKTDFDLTNETKAKYFIEMDKQVIMSHKPIYNMIEKHKSKNGDIIWEKINKIPLKDPNGKIIGILGTFEDITMEKQTEKKLTNNIDKYKNLIESTSTSWIIMNTKFKILEANELFQNLMGCDFVGDIIGKNPRTWVSNEHIEKFDNALIGLLNGKAIDNIEVNIINEKNKAIYVSLNANVIENGEKKIFCLVRDLSKKKNEEDKKYIQKEKQKDGIKQKLMEIKSELVKLTI